VAVVDGNDVQAVSEAARAAVTRIRAGDGPQFLELRTYRLRGHFEPDDQAYVDGDELASWRSRDPITLLEQRLREQGCDAATLAGIEADARERINQAVAFAQNSPWPEPATLTRHVYAGEEVSS
jgi:pyruvate dehydrogenase E1 component alpha subunit